MSRVASARQRTALMVNGELMRLYWQIDRSILDRQASQGWGAKVIERLARDLRDAPRRRPASRQLRLRHYEDNARYKPSITSNT